MPGGSVIDTVGVFFLFIKTNMNDLPCSKYVMKLKTIYTLNKKRTGKKTNKQTKQNIVPIHLDAYKRLIMFLLNLMNTKNKNCTSHFRFLSSTLVAISQGCRLQNSQIKGRGSQSDNDRGAWNVFLFSIICKVVG